MYITAHTVLQMCYNVLAPDKLLMNKYIIFVASLIQQYILY